MPDVVFLHVGIHVVGACTIQGYIHGSIIKLCEQHNLMWMPYED